MTMNLHLVPFDEDVLYLVDHEGQPYVPVRPICDALGLEWERQRKKLNEGRFSQLPLLCTSVAADGKKREMLCLPLRKIPAWIFSINPTKVREDIRPKLVRYQEECDEALWNYWSEGMAVNPRKAPGRQPDFPSHAADRLVAAGRAFREALRSAKALGLPEYEAVTRANDAARHNTGMDVLSELGVEAPQRPDIPQDEPFPGDPGSFLREWLNGQLPVPRCICRSMDLYRAYRLWCTIDGGDPVTIKRLVRAARDIDYKMPRKFQVRFPDGRYSQPRCIVPPGAIDPSCKEPLERVTARHILLFESALEKWERKVLQGGEL